MKQFDLSAISSFWYFIQMCDRTKKVAEATQRHHLNVEETYEAITIGRGPRV